MGYINVFTGPMKCGKSQKLITEVKRKLIAGKNIKIFKPLIDDRYGDNFISTRFGTSMKAISIRNISEISKYDADYYFIDEFQFLKGDVNIIDKMATSGKNFFIAGLNLTSEKKPFGLMASLMCIADNIEVMTSVCDICKSDSAIFTYYKGQKNKDIVIGDNEYIPVCRECYQDLIDHKVSVPSKLISNNYYTNLNINQIAINNISC